MRILKNYTKKGSNLNIKTQETKIALAWPKGGKERTLPLKAGKWNFLNGFV
jgi:hypothetical protein